MVVSSGPSVSSPEDSSSSCGQTLLPLGCFVGAGLRTIGPLSPVEVEGVGSTVTEETEAAITEERHT